MLNRDSDRFGSMTVTGVNDKDEQRAAISTVQRTKARERKRLLSIDNELSIRDQDNCYNNVGIRRVTLFSHSYEETLFRTIPRGIMVDFTVELVISRLGKNGRHIVTFKDRFLLRAGLPILQDGPGCPFCCKHELVKPIHISKKSTIQLIIKDGYGTVGKLFLLRLDLSDMPINSQTLIRQKHYYCNAFDTTGYLQHGLQVMIKRIKELVKPIASLDNNGNLKYTPARKVERTILDGSFRLIFSFNQAAAIGTNKTDDGYLREQLKIITEYPTKEKYFPITVTATTTTDDERRISPLGQIL